MFRRSRSTTELTPAEAAERQRRGELVLVDVREDDERAEARPAGSQHVPLGELADRVRELPRDRTVAFICRSGGRSSKATEIAVGENLQVADVRGGLIAWQAAGLPVETGAERPATRGGTR